MSVSDEPPTLLDGMLHEITAVPEGGGAGSGPGEGDGPVAGGAGAAGGTGVDAGGGAGGEEPDDAGSAILLREMMSSSYQV